MKQWIGHIIALLVIVVWGITFVSSKVLLNHGLLPAEIFAIRFFLAYLCMIVICRKPLWSMNVKDELMMAGLGVMGGALYFLTENYALLYGSTSNVAILVSSTPLLTALVVGLFFRAEWLKSRQWIGTFIAFIGMAMVVFNGEVILRLNPLGDILAITAALMWAFYSLFMRFVVDRYSVDFITRKVFAYGLLGILSVLFIHPSEVMMHPMQMLQNPVVIGNLMFLAFIASTACFLLWNWSMKIVGTVRATNYIYIQSVVTMIVAWLVLDERITWMAIIGIAVLIGGMVLVQRR